MTSLMKFLEQNPSKAIPPLYSALVKNEQDVQLLERLAFMARREGTQISLCLFHFSIL